MMACAGAVRCAVHLTCGVRDDILGHAAQFAAGGHGKDQRLAGLFQIIEIFPKRVFRNARALGQIIHRHFACRVERQQAEQSVKLLRIIDPVQGCQIFVQHPVRDAVAHKRRGGDTVLAR